MLCLFVQFSRLTVYSQSLTEQLVLDLEMLNFETLNQPPRAIPDSHVNYMNY